MRECWTCGHRGEAPTFPVREMLLGTRRVFDYWQCEGCGSLQIEAVPEDLGDFYPQGYFSFRSQARLAGSRLRARLDPLRLAHHLGSWNLPGAIANRVLKPLDYAPWLRAAGLDANARVLDVGCGSGKLLVRMRLGGLAECQGVDPFLPEPLRYPNGVVVHRERLVDFAPRHPGRFDLVMFHHSLEHVPDPEGHLCAAATALSDRGRVLVRVPVADCHAFRTYREDWMALDAPRHLFVPSRAGLGRLAERCGFRVERVEGDSTPQQFIASELYRRDIPGSAPRAEKAVFSRRQRAVFAAEARRLNAAGDGDMAAFYLARA